MPVKLTEEEVEEIFTRAAQHEGYQVTVDLENQTVTDDHGLSLKFDVDAARRERLLNGMDDIATTLKHADKIAAYEEANGIT